MFALMLIARRALRQARREDGVIAVLTLAFLLGAGAVCLISLWAIGWATGVYNAQYAATQSAAYAAASRVVNSQTETYEQLAIDCTNGAGVALFDDNAADPYCASGSGNAAAPNAHDAAVQALRASLGDRASNPAAFGLTYGQSLFLANESFQPAGGITIYNIDEPAGAAQADSGGGASCLKSDPNGAAGAVTRLCWRTRDQAWTYGTQYQSGVVVRTVAPSLAVPPTCPAKMCFRISLKATASATAAQPGGVGSSG